MNRIPAEIQRLLDDYVAQLTQALPDLMVACYLHGSIALGAFDPTFSDIDFVTILKRPGTPAELDSLAAIHAQLAEHYPQWTMDGCYLQVDDVGKSPREIPPHPYFNEKFDAQSHGGVGWVIWWLLTHGGIAAIGDDPQTLAIEMDWDAFLADMYTNINTYWVRFIRDPRRIIWLRSDEGIMWAVLGILRLFYTLQERAITSKIGAGEYGLQHMPQHWHRIIQEALRIRQQKPSSLYRFRLQRLWIAHQFLQYVVYCYNERTAMSTPKKF